MADLAEVDENFVRKGLSKVDYGELLLRRKEIYESIHPETRRGMRNGISSVALRHARILKSYPIGSTMVTAVSCLLGLDNDTI